MMTCSCHSLLVGFVRSLVVLPLFHSAEYQTFSYDRSVLPLPSKVSYLLKGYGKCEISYYCRISAIHKARFKP